MTGSPELDEAAAGPAVSSAAPSDAGSAGDAAFWGTTSYRSGGVGWREFLAIDDGDDVDFTTPFAAEVTEVAEAAESTGVGVELTAPRVALSELASSSGLAPEQLDPAPEGFGSWSTSSDDLLPSR